MKPTIVISGSASLQNDIAYYKEHLSRQGTVLDWPKPIEGDFLEQYPQVHADFYHHIAACDMLFVMNVDKGDNRHYIGPGAFAEMAYAVALNQTKQAEIRIVTLHPLPEYVPYAEELVLWRDLGWITEYNH